jgi:hypothetical protein
MQKLTIKDPRAEPEQRADARKTINAAAALVRERYTDTDPAILALKSAGGRWAEAVARARGLTVAEAAQALRAERDAWEAKMLEIEEAREAGVAAVAAAEGIRSALRAALAAIDAI